MSNYIDSTSHATTGAHENAHDLHNGHHDFGGEYHFHTELGVDDTEMGPVVHKVDMHEAPLPGEDTSGALAALLAHQGGMGTEQLSLAEAKRRSQAIVTKPKKPPPLYGGEEEAPTGSGVDSTLRKGAKTDKSTKRSMSTTRSAPGSLSPEYVGKKGLLTFRNEDNNSPRVRGWVHTGNLLSFKFKGIGYDDRKSAWKLINNDSVVHSRRALTR